MIVLDTNVVSEAMKPAPHSADTAFLPPVRSATTVPPGVALAELLYGIAALPHGKRKDRLSGALDGLLTLFDARVLPFDAEAARHYAELAMTARRAGQGFPTADGFIAAIAVSRGFVVASRDVSPYRAGGVVVIDPWEMQDPV